MVKHLIKFHHMKNTELFTRHMIKVLHLPNIYKKRNNNAFVLLLNEYQELIELKDKIVRNMINLEDSKNELMKIYNK